jgi:hypothetical protein
MSCYVDCSYLFHDTVSISDGSVIRDYSEIQGTLGFSTQIFGLKKLYPPTFIHTYMPIHFTDPKPVDMAEYETCQ